MALIDDLLFEVARRVVNFTPNTKMPDNSLLGYDGNPNLAVSGNTAGETLIVACPLGSHYTDSNGKIYAKNGPTSWFQIGQVGDTGGAESTRVEITQASHGFNFDFIYHNGTEWVKALADHPTHVASHFAVSTGVNTFYAYTGGEIDTSGMTDVNSNALTPGAYYYLSQTTAGKVTPVLAQTGVNQSLLKANSTDNATLIFGAAVAETAANQIRTFVNQVAHGFVNDFIRHNGTTWVKALGDDASHAATHFAARIDDDKFYAVLYGDVDLTGTTDDLAGALVAETTYYLSQSVAGKVTTTPGALGISQIVLRTKSATEGSVITDQPGGGASGGGGDATSVRSIVAQATHGFTKDFVYHDGTAWAKAIADDEDHAATHFAMSIDTGNFYLVSIGEMNVSDVLDDESGALVAGEYYVLSQTVAGKVRRTIPTSGLIQFVMKMNAAGSASIIVEEPYGAEPTSPSTGFGELDVQDHDIDLAPPPAGLIRFYIKSGALFLRAPNGDISQATVPDAWEHVQFEDQVATPATPSVGNVRFFFEGGIAKVIDAAGVVRVLGADAGSSGINFVKDSDAEAGLGDWITYADGAAIPVDGTGGTPSITLTATTVNPLRGSKSFLISKPASNRLGDGISYTFTIDATDKGQTLFVSFDFGSNIAVGQVKVFVFDIAGNKMSAVTSDSGIIGNGRYVGAFAASNNTQYRLCVHVESSSAVAFDLRLDTITITPATPIAFVTPKYTLSNGGYNMDFQPATLTGNRTITYPDATGTVALTSVANTFAARQDVNTTDGSWISLGKDAVTKYASIMGKSSATQPVASSVSTFVLGSSGSAEVAFLVLVSFSNSGTGGSALLLCGYGGVLPLMTSNPTNFVAGAAPATGFGVAYVSTTRTLTLTAGASLATATSLYMTVIGNGSTP